MNANQFNLFHNTAGLSGSDLKKATIKAGFQRTDVEEYFKTHSEDEYITPEKAHEYLKEKNPDKYKNAPLTSIRRAFDYLKNNGIIELTGKRPGHYGIDVNAYKYALK